MFPTQTSTNQLIWASFYSFYKIKDNNLLLSLNYSEAENMNVVVQDVVLVLFHVVASRWRKADVS